MYSGGSGVWDNGFYCGLIGIETNLCLQVEIWVINEFSALFLTLPLKTKLIKSRQSGSCKRSKQKRAKGKNRERRVLRSRGLFC